MRVAKRAGDVEIGDKVFFPNSRRPVKVGQALVKDGRVQLFSDDQTAKWMMNADFEVSIEVEDEEE